MSVTATEIAEELGIPDFHVHMAIYSGYLPKPYVKQDTSDFWWTDEKISPFIERWKERIKRRKS